MASLLVLSSFLFLFTELCSLVTFIFKRIIPGLFCFIFIPFNTVDRNRKLPITEFKPRIYDVRSDDHSTKCATTTADSLFVLAGKTFYITVYFETKEEALMILPYPNLLLFYAFFFSFNSEKNLSKSIIYHLGRYLHRQVLLALGHKYLIYLLFNWYLIINLK